MAKNTLICTGLFGQRNAPVVIKGVKWHTLEMQHCTCLVIEHSSCGLTLVKAMSEKLADTNITILDINGLVIKHSHLGL